MLVLHKMLDQAALDTMQQQSECHHSLQHWKSQKQTSTFGKQLPSSAVYSCGPYLLLPLFSTQSLQKHGDKFLDYTAHLPPCVFYLYCTHFHPYVFLSLSHQDSSPLSFISSKSIFGWFVLSNQIRVCSVELENRKDQMCTKLFQCQNSIGHIQQGHTKSLLRSLLPLCQGKKLTSVLRKCLHVC